MSLSSPQVLRRLLRRGGGAGVEPLGPLDELAVEVRELLGEDRRADRVGDEDVLVVGGALAQPELLRGGLHLLQAPDRASAGARPALAILNFSVVFESVFIAVVELLEALHERPHLLLRAGRRSFCRGSSSRRPRTSVIARTVSRSRSTRLTGQPRLAIASLVFSQAASAVRDPACRARRASRWARWARPGRRRSPPARPSAGTPRERLHPCPASVAIAVAPDTRRALIPDS